MAAVVARGLGSLVQRSSGLSSHGQVLSKRFTSSIADADLKKARELAEEICKVLKAPEVTMDTVRPLVQDLTSTVQLSPAKIAEALSKTLKEPPTKASKEKADALLELLRNSLKAEERPVTINHLNQQKLVSKVAKVENGLQVNITVTVVLASIFGGGMLVMLSEMKDMNLDIRTIRERSASEHKKTKKQFYQMDSRLREVEPKLTCTSCGEAAVSKTPTVDELPEDDEPSTPPADNDVQESDGWTNWFWGAWKKLMGH